MAQKSTRANTPYQGFEQGPIRPPSEARSLLIRVTRNCPWNRCTFCPVYKGTRFSLRPVDHVLRDIDAVHAYDAAALKCMDASGRLDTAAAREAFREIENQDSTAMNAALNWRAHGARSIFLQDANSLILKPEDLILILRRLRNRFPWVERITSYARSHTIARISDEHLAQMREAGLNRIHIGMESGSDKVLSFVKKGSDKKTQVKAGQKVVRAGMELSEYIMPGLGGKALSRDHALETADAVNRINPHFIRLRSLAVPDIIPLFADLTAGRFEKLPDQKVAEEILLFIENLDGITSTLKSDHILNLFQEVEGVFPRDKERMMRPLRDFLALPSEERMVYQVGRRLGVFSSLSHLNETNRRGRVEETCRQWGITPENTDAVIDELMKRFI